MTGPDLADTAREVRARYRTAQGLPPTIEDAAVCDRLAALLDPTRDDDRQVAS